MTYTVPGDGIDNDCDGRIDEEICEGDGLQNGKYFSSTYRRWVYISGFELFEEFEKEKYGNDKCKLDILT